MHAMQEQDNWNKTERQRKRPGSALCTLGNRRSESGSIHQGNNMLSQRLGMGGVEGDRAGEGQSRRGWGGWRGAERRVGLMP